MEIRRRGAIIKGEVVWSTRTRFGLRSDEPIDVDALTAESDLKVTPARGDEPARRVLAHRLTETTRVWPFGAVVVWRLRLTGTDCVVELPDGVPAPVTRSPWWLELVSTGFDQDAGCALMRGVLHAPVTANAGPPAWRMALQDVPGSGRSPMPVDAMGVRVGR